MIDYLKSCVGCGTQYTFKNAKYYIKIILITVAKTCEKVLGCLRLKVEHDFNNKSERSKLFILK